VSERKEDLESVSAKKILVVTIPFFTLPLSPIP